VYPGSFTAKYNCNKLVYYEFFPRIEEAKNEESIIKVGSRKKKVQRINSINPKWLDLYDQLMEG
jgi:putative endonuclease